MQLDNLQTLQYAHLYDKHNTEISKQYSNLYTVTFMHRSLHTHLIICKSRFRS